MKKQIKPDPMMRRRARKPAKPAMRCFVCGTPLVLWEEYKWRRCMKHVAGAECHKCGEYVLYEDSPSKLGEHHLCKECY